MFNISAPIRKYAVRATQELAGASKMGTSDAESIRKTAQPSATRTAAYRDQILVPQPTEPTLTAKLWGALEGLTRRFNRVPAELRAAHGAGLFSRQPETRQHQVQRLNDFAAEATQAMLSGSVGPSRESYYRLLGGLIEDPLLYAKHRYGDTEGQAAHDRLSDLDRKSLPLLADPGLVLRVEAFAEFVSASDLSHSDPWSLRAAFSDSLGTARLYRGVRVPAETAAQIRREVGFVPAAFRSAGAYQPAELLRVGTTRVGRLQAYHVLPPLSSDPSSPFISTTTSRTIAENNIGTAMFGLENPVTVFELKIPVLDTLPTAGRFAFSGEKEDSVFFGVARDEITE